VSPIRPKQTIFSGQSPRRLAPEAQNTMAANEELKSLLEIVESIHNRFIQRMITGQRDAMVGEALVTPKSESDDDRLKSHIDSQRGTF
jgi:hypothetical protein